MHYFPVSGIHANYTDPKLSMGKMAVWAVDF